MATFAHPLSLDPPHHLHLHPDLPTFPSLYHLEPPSHCITFPPNPTPLSSSVAPLELPALIPPEDAFAHLPHLPPQLPLLLPGDPGAGAGGVLQPLAKENLD